MSITRIQNNQITDSTIVAYAKLQAGSLTGNLFAPTVTLNSNVTINGNLFLANTGNTAIVNATNTYINDPVVVFNNGYSGSLTGYDIGMLVNRNLSPMLPYGSQVNTAWMWVEADQAFEAIATTDTGTGSVGITNLGFANIKVGNTAITGFQTVAGYQTVGGNLTVTGASALNTVTGASFQGVIGNVTPYSSVFTTTSTGGLQAVAIGNVTPGTAVFTTQSTGGLQAVAIGNVTPGTAVFTTATTGGLQASAIGNVTPGTAAFTTLTASGIAQVTNATNNNGLAYTNGALQVTGGAGFGGNVYIGGNAIIAGNVVTTGNVDVINVSGNSAQFFGNTAGFGALYAGITAGFVYQPQTVLQSSTNFNGYAQLNHQNINSGSLASSDYVATANNGSANDTYIDMGIASSTYNYSGFGIIKPNDGYLLVQGNTTTGGGNLVLTSGLNDIVFAPGGSNANNEYGRINASNVFVIKSTVASTNTTTGAITVAGGVGIQGAVYTGGLLQATGGLQNTQVGSVNPNTGAFTTLTASGTTLGLTTATAINSTPIGNSAPSTGAFTSVNVSGASTLNTITGASFQGVIGNVTPFAGTFTTLIANGTTLGLTTAAALNNTPIGNSTPSTGAFTTGAFNTATTGGLQAAAIGNVTPGTGAFTTATATTINAVTIGNVGTTLTGTISTPAQPNITSVGTLTGLSISGASIFGTVTGASFQGVIGNVTPSTATFTTQTTGGLQAVAIGNVTPGTGAFTTGTFNTATTGGLQAVAIGNATPGTGAFTTLSASGITQITDATQATSTTTGALRVAGGISTQSNLFVGGSVKVTGNLEVDGTLTYLNTTVTQISGSEVVAGVLQANSGTASTSTTTGALQVLGGAGVTGSLYVGSDIQTPAIGSVTPGTAVFTTATTGGLQAVAIGNVTPGTAAFTTQTTGGLQAVAIGNVTPGTATFTTQSTGGLQAVAIGNVTPGTAVFTTATTGGLQVVAIGNVTPGTAAFTTVTASTLSAATIGNTGATLTGTLSTAAQPNVTSLGTLTGLTVSGATALNTVTGASFQGVIGNVAPAAGTFTTVTANTETVGGLQAVAIGNISPGSAVFTTASAGTLQVVTLGGVTPGTGAFTTLTTQGLQSAAIGNTTPGTGAFTSLSANTLSASSLTLPAINNTVIGNVTPLSGFFTTLNSSGVLTSTGNIVAASGTPSTNNRTGALIVDGGVGITGRINAGEHGVGIIHQLLGNVVIGTDNGPASVQTALEVNMNNAAPFNSTSVVHVAAKVDTSGKITLDSMGTFSGNNVPSLFIARTARGTASAPTSVQSGDMLGGFIGRGYGSTAFNILPGIQSSGILLRATQNFTDTTQGTELVFTVIPNNSSIARVGMLLDQAGALTVNNSISTNSLTSGNIYTLNDATVAGNLAVLGTDSYFANNLSIAGLVTISDTTSTDNTSTGALVVQGGIATAGNINAAGQLFVGTGAQTTQLTNAFIVERGTSDTGPGNQYTQHAIINDTNTGSADFVAYGNNYPGPDNDHGWVDVGFTGDAYDDPIYSITKANDGYIFASGANATVGGNLVLSTDYTGGYNDIVFGVGSFSANSEVARFHGNVATNGTFKLKLPTNATGTVSANTGALQVAGGASFGGNVYTGGAVTINGAQTANNDFKVKGVNTDNLIWARPNSTYETVVIGNTLSTAGLTNGAKLVVNSNDSMLMPVGTTGQRPSSLGYTDVAGMLRYNTSLNSLEFFNGTIWQVPTSTFTVITDQQFTATGSSAVFTLSTATTTAATIVSINGILQFPALAYNITGGTTLTFTETPAADDIIDVRTLSTSSTIGTLSDGSGVNSVTINPALTTNGNVGVIFTTGTIGNQNNQYGIDSQGGFVTLSPNVTVASSGIATVVDNLYANAYSSAEYTVTSTIRGTNIREITKILMVHNGSAAGAGTASVTVISNLCTAGNTLVSWTAGTSGNIAQLKATTANNNTIMRIKRDYQAI